MEGNKDRFKFTDKVLERARALRARGGSGYKGKMSWEEIANILECSKASLVSIICRVDAGLREQNKLEKVRSRIEARLLETEGKIKVKDLAKEFGVGRVAMHQRLTRMGFDKEVREELSDKS